MKERFWGFFNPESQDAEALSKVIMEQLQIVLKDNTEKLIAQTYDGAAVMMGEKSGVQTRVRDTYKFAYFVHCYAHQLNLIMEQAASQNPQVRIFFSSLTGIPTFFPHSPLRLAALDNVSRRIPRGSNTRWNFNSQVLNTVYENVDVLRECFRVAEN